MTDERRLAFALRSGSRKEPKATFQYLFERYQPLVAFIAARYLKNRADIEDAVQETFVNFFSHAEGVRVSVKSYLAASAKNISLRILKRSGEADLGDPDEFAAPPSDALAGEEFRELLAEMRRALPEKDVRTILMHLVDDMTFSEIARRCGEKEKTVKTRYYRALKKFQRVWEAKR